MQHLGRAWEQNSDFAKSCAAGVGGTWVEARFARSVGTFPGMWENPVRTEKPALPLYYDDDDDDYDCSSHCKAAHGGHPAIALGQCLKPERGPIVSLTTNSSRTAFYRVTIRITTKCHYCCLIGADSGVLNCPRPPNLLAPLIDVLAKSSTEVLKLRI